MTNGKSLVAPIVLLFVGFSFGLALRPVILPATTIAVLSAKPSATSAQIDARGVQYFEANIDEARRIAAACRKGTVRGEECANAETALTAVESEERFRRFREDR
jgi:hypothetical protein